jgi:steroid delta-isomerase-like uncharacterized protein
LGAEENKAIIRRYVDEAWRRNNPEAVDDHVAPDAVFHDLARQGLPAGPEGVKQSIRDFWSAMPDMDMRIDDIIAEGDTIAFRWTAWGTHLGDLQGVPPSRRNTDVTGIVYARLRDGRIVEGWQEMDVLGMLTRLRILPKGGMPRPMVKAMYLGQRLADRIKEARRRR